MIKYQIQHESGDFLFVSYFKIYETTSREEAELKLNELQRNHRAKLKIVKSNESRISH